LSASLEPFLLDAGVLRRPLLDRFDERAQRNTG
jgi:hypothetical protein